jgi:zinc/manganese transport system substrate-binding protein/manganese/iron transport system substrate-binding protein
MTTIAINGFGRIGRLVFRALVEQGHLGTTFNVVAVGDIVPADNLAYLLKYDSTQGKFSGTVSSKKSSPELEEDDVLVVNGQGLEPWAADAIAAAGFVGTIIVASVPVDPETRDGVIDPHVWTDPANAAKMTQFISQRLGTLNPKDADVYTRNANAYELQLEILDGWILETFDLVPAQERLLVTNHDAFTYFVSAYDITLVGSIIPEFDDNAEPSAADIDALIAKISQTGVRAIFAESSISPKLAETIAAEAGIRVFAGDDSLYSDTLGAPGSGSESYISATIHNVKLLAQSWGVVAPPVPKEIANA